jgi:hypothetical protein
MLPSSVVFSVVASLNFPHPNYFTTGYSLCRIQNSDCPLAINDLEGTNISGCQLLLGLESPGASHG